MLRQYSKFFLRVRNSIKEILRLGSSKFYAVRIGNTSNSTFKKRGQKESAAIWECPQILQIIS